MRARHWLGMAGVALLLALAAAVLLLPGLLDWNRFRPQIAALAGDSLGRVVHIDGGVSLVLLPEPVLTARNVTISPPGDGTVGRMTASELRLRVVLPALLAGRLEASAVVLRGVDLRLPWPLPPDALVIRPPDWLAGLSARIERGHVSIGSIDLADIAATLTTAEATGTYRIAGTATAASRPWRFTLQLSRPGGDGASGLDATLDGQGIGASISGQIGADGSFAGHVAGGGADLSQLLPAPPLPFRADGRLSFAGGLVAADELTADLGGVPVQGAVALRLGAAPRLDLAVTASRLDLDAWWAALTRHREQAFPLTLGIDLSTEAARFAGGTVRGVRAAFDLGAAGLDLRELRATLPGEAGLSAAGRLVLPTPQQPVHFDGFVAVTAPAPRVTLAWLSRDAEAALPGSVLRQLALSGHLVAEPGLLALDGVTGTLDDAAVEGALTLRAGPRPAVKAALKLGRLDLAPYRARAAGWTDLIATVAGLDADVRLDIADLATGTLPLHAVTLDAASETGRLALRRFEADLGAVHVTAAGTLLDGTRLADGHFTLAAPGTALQDRLLAPLWPDWLLHAVPATAAIWRAPLALDLLASGSPAAVTAKLTAQIGDLRAEITPTLAPAGGRWSASIALRHPGAPRLFETLGLPGTAAWLGDGSLGLVAQLQGQPGRLAADSFDLSAGALHASGSLALGLADAARSLTGRVDFDMLPLPLPYFRATQPFPTPDLTGWEAAVPFSANQVLLGLSPLLGKTTGQFLLDGGRLRLDGLAGTIAGGRFTASASLDTRAEPPAATLAARIDNVTLANHLFDLPLDLDGGSLDATLDLAASGHAPGTLLATLGGTMQATLRNGGLAGVTLAGLKPPYAAAAIGAALAGGNTEYDRIDLDFAIARGTLALRDAHLAGPSGTIAASGLIDLVGASEELRLDLTPAGAGAPRLGLRLAGPAATPTRTPDLADLIRWRAANPP
jgi:hypothetical protein